MSDDTPPIRIETRGAAGVIHLNRPQALNALTLDMVRAIAAALDNWEGNPSVTCVVVTAAGGRAFCAGGDIRALHDLGKAGQIDEALRFWRTEYPLNRRIKTYPKPYVSLIGGMVMGGGVGISLHGSHRVAGPDYAFAMPEVGIGFFPDVGATWALPRLRGATGMWLALTGARLGRDPALHLGLATHAMRREDETAIVEALCAGELVEDVLARFADPDVQPADLPDRDVIDACFGWGSVPEIVSALEKHADTSSFAAEALADLRGKSPTSLAIACEQMRRGLDLTFEAAMELEYRIVVRILRGHDFYEGVRAMVLDKDRTPRWQPDRIDAVDSEKVAGYVAPLDESEGPELAI